MSQLGKAEVVTEKREEARQKSVNSMKRGGQSNKKRERETGLKVDDVVEKVMILKTAFNYGNGV
jgi:hypothetical protein